MDAFHSSSSSSSSRTHQDSQATPGQRTVLTIRRHIHQGRLYKGRSRETNISVFGIAEGDHNFALGVVEHSHNYGILMNNAASRIRLVAYTQFMLTQNVIQDATNWSHFDTFASVHQIQLPHPQNPLTELPGCCRLAIRMGWK